MRFSFVCFICASLAAAAPPVTEIKVDQVGYLPTAPKIALVAAAQPASTFTIRRTSDSSIVFRGQLATPVDDKDTGDRVQWADFTTFNKTGTYFLDVPGVGRSWNFTIAGNVYDRAWYLVTRAFYGQRCGIAVDLGPEFPGFKHDACHLQGAYHGTSGKVGEAPSTGGWHDAGDYGRYIVTGYRRKVSWRRNTRLRSRARPGTRPDGCGEQRFDCEQPPAS